MTLDEILASLFPDGCKVENDNGILTGYGSLQAGGQGLVIAEATGELPLYTPGTYAQALASGSVPGDRPTNGR